MSINFAKYINITSGVVASPAVSARELIGRLFTTNPLLPTDSFIEFTNAADVGTYFGTSSEEYARASFYFSFIGKNITSPQKISFARWTNANTAPMIFGAPLTTSLTAFNLITNGAFSLTLGGVTHVISGLDFSAAGSLAAVAAIIQAAIRLESGTQWTAADVTYAATPGTFNFVGGDNTVVANVIVAPGNTGTDISTIMGWYPEYPASAAVWSDGQQIETITDVLTTSAAASNNFGSFIFMTNAGLDLAQITEAAAWNSSQVPNIAYQYYVGLSVANDTSYQAALNSFNGVGLTIIPVGPYTDYSAYSEMLPMIFLASTDYTQRNSTINYMFQQANVSPSIFDTTLSNALDALLINYYGQTQQAGTNLSFYQRGYLFGGANSPQDMNIYANEQWLKDAMGVALMNLLIAMPKVPANAQGQALVLATLLDIINLALFNGTISVQGILTSLQKVYIANVTGDANAWYQVQNIGYWIECVIVQVQVGPNVEYQARYTLVYKKDDVVRSVTGRQLLV